MEMEAPTVGMPLFGSSVLCIPQCCWQLPTFLHAPREGSSELCVLPRPILAFSGRWLGIMSVDLSVRPGNADAGREEKWIYSSLHVGQAPAAAVLWVWRVGTREGFSSSRDRSAPVSKFCTYAPFGSIKRKVKEGAGGGGETGEEEKNRLGFGEFKITFKPWGLCWSFPTPPPLLLLLLPGKTPAAPKGEEMMLPASGDPDPGRSSLLQQDQS